MWKNVLTVGRDLVLLGLGAFGVLHEELTGRANVPLLVVYTSLLGVPGAAQVVSLVRTGSPSPRSPAPESSPPSLPK